MVLLAPHPRKADCPPYESKNISTTIIGLLFVPLGNEAFYQGPLGGVYGMFDSANIRMCRVK